MRATDLRPRVGTVPVAPAFDPSDISAVICHIKTDGGSNVLNGSAAAASDGETVDSWISEVGSYTFQNTTDAQRPIFTDDGSGVNGKPYLLFDGTDDRLVHAGALSTSVDGEVFIVVDKPSLTSDSIVIWGLGLSGSNTPWGRCYLRSDSSGGAMVVDGNAGGANTSNQFYSGPVHIINQRHDGTNISVYKGSVLNNTPSAINWWGDVTAHDRFTIGGLTRISFVSPFAGRIYEMIFCDAVLAATERAQVMTYLRGKYRETLTFAAIGDSIMARGGVGGFVYDGWNPSVSSSSVAKGVSFIEHAAGSEDLDDAVARWTDEISGEGYDGLFILSGIIDMSVDSDADTAFAKLETILDGAVSEGMYTLVATLLPWGNEGTWTAARQIQSADFNDQIRAKVSADVSGLLQLVEFYDNAGDTNPEELLAAWDSGDGLHPNATGYMGLAALLDAQLSVLR